MNSNTKSSAELKNEVMEDIHKLKNDLKVLKDRLTPGQIIDDALFYRTKKTPRETFDYLKSNPIGTSFLALGTMMLMEDEAHLSYESHAKAKSSQVFHVTKDIAEGIKDEVKSRLPKGEKKNSAPNVDTNFSTSDSQNITSKLADTKEQVKDAVQEKLEGVKSLGPLSYMALGAGLGALSGAAMTLSKKEEEMNAGALTHFSEELQEALNASINILKNEFIHDFADFDLKVFGGPQESASSVNAS